MLLLRDLLFRGIGGIGVLGGAAYGGYHYRNDIGNYVKKNIPAPTKGNLMDRAGLYCMGLEEGRCYVSGNSLSIGVEIGEDFFEVSPSSSSRERIMVYGAEEGEGYENNLKFVIEGGDIGSSTVGKKLEEFETYELKKSARTSGMVLSRKRSAVEEKARMLGLEGCKFPEGDDPVTCTIEGDKINGVNFHGKGEGVTLSGTLTIEISKINYDFYFPHGYKFKITSTSGDLNINSSGDNPIVLSQGVEEEFKIRKENGTLSLEGAWNKDTLTRKVRLSCEGVPGVDEPVTCLKRHGDRKVRVKRGLDEEDFQLSNIPTEGGKIQLFKDSGDGVYNKNLFLTIEDGDIEGTEPDNKLEQFETYEIKDINGTFYLVRRGKSSEEKRKLLGFADSCKFPERSAQPQEVTCTLSDSTEINNIKFDGKSGEISVNPIQKLNVKVATSKDTEYFPHGYKLKLTTTGSKLTIPRGSRESIVIPTSEEEEFRIKRSSKHRSLSLEEAWNQETLTRKVGIVCEGTPSESNSIDCSIRSKAGTKIKVKQGEETFEVSTIGDGRSIKLYKSSVGGYFKHFKFVIMGDNIDGNKGKKLEKYETYEIKRKDTSTDEFHLTRKTDVKDEFRKSLGLYEISGCEIPTNSCDISGENFKKIKFDVKDEEEITVAPKNAKLKITKVTSEDDKKTFPLDYRFVLETNEDIKISSTISVTKDTNTEFKIKQKGISNGELFLSLAKAWTPAYLGKKVKLDCKSGSKDCEFGTKKVISVWDSDQKNVVEISVKDTDKNKKIKYLENQPGYNQGIKFYVDDKDGIQLGNTPAKVTGKAGGSRGAPGAKGSPGPAAPGAGAIPGAAGVPQVVDNTKPNKIEHSSVATYEIKEIKGTWYLVRKNVDKKEPRPEPVQRSVQGPQG